MKNNGLLTVASLITLALLMIHFTQDVMYQPDHTNLYPIPVAVFALCLYATLMASDRVWGLIVIFLEGVLGAGMIIVHSRGAEIGNSHGFFFVLTLFAVSTTGWFTAILSARGLLAAFRDRRAGAAVS